MGMPCLKIIDYYEVLWYCTLVPPGIWWDDSSLKELDKMVFISQTHLFIIVLNVLFGQH
jgi:hypothetical protein